VALSLRLTPRMTTSYSQGAVGQSGEAQDVSTAVMRLLF